MPKQKRTHVEKVVVLLTREDRKALERKAKRREETMSETVRAAISALPTRRA